MIYTDKATCRDLADYGIIDASVKAEDLPEGQVTYRRYSREHFERALLLIRKYALFDDREMQLLWCRFEIGDSEDMTIQNILMTFLAFAISVIALYKTMSPNVSFAISDWKLVTIFSVAFLFFFMILITERFKNKKRRFYSAVIDCLLDE